MHALFVKIFSDGSPSLLSKRSLRRAIKNSTPPQRRSTRARHSCVVSRGSRQGCRPGQARCRPSWRHYVNRISFWRAGSLLSWGEVLSATGNDSELKLVNRRTRPDNADKRCFFSRSALQSVVTKNGCRFPRVTAAGSVVSFVAACFARAIRRFSIRRFSTITSRCVGFQR